MFKSDCLRATAPYLGHKTGPWPRFLFVGPVENRTLKRKAAQRQLCQGSVGGAGLEPENDLAARSKVKDPPRMALPHHLPSRDSKTGSRFAKCRSITSRIQSSCDGTRLGYAPYCTTRSSHSGSSRSRCLLVGQVKTNDFPVAGMRPKKLHVAQTGHKKKTTP